MSYGLWVMGHACPSPQVWPMQGLYAAIYYLLSYAGPHRPYKIQRIRDAKDKLPKLRQDKL